jgi:hypothetical protein
MKMGVPISLMSVCVLALSGIAAESQTVTFSEGNGCGSFAAIAPDFKLKDAFGKNYESRLLYRERGMVVMVSTTNLTQYERQKKWEKYIKQAGVPRDNAPACVVIEDVSQQSSHRDKAIQMMQEKSREDSRELFLIDENGEVRRSFGVDQNETVILIVDSSGCVVHHESDEVEPCTDSGQRVARFIRKLAEAAQSAAVAVAQTHTPAGK